MERVFKNLKKISKGCEDGAMGKAMASQATC